MAKRFITPFAEAGDRAAMSDTPVGAECNYLTGYPPQYEEDPDAHPTTAKFVERDKSNQLFNDITANIKEWQEHGYPAFITSAVNGGVPFAYAKNAIVTLSNVDYISKENGNIDVPPSAKWVVLDPFFINDLSQAYEYPTVDLMKSSAVSLPPGKTIKTQGYYDGWAALANPSGNAEYITTTLQNVRDTLSDSAWIPNEFSDHTLNDGSIAMLQKDGIAISSQYGLKGDGTTDNYARMQAMFDDEFSVQFTFGDYLITQGISVRGATAIRCDSLARVTAGADNITMFNADDTINGSIHVYDLVCSARTAASVFHTGVTGFSIENAGYNTNFVRCRWGQMYRGLHLKANVFGIAVTDPQCAAVSRPIELGDPSGGVAGTIMIDNPIFDNSAFAAGDNGGKGVLLHDSCSATVKGGYIQGFTTGIQCAGPGTTLTVDTVYFENTTNEAIKLSNNRYANIVRCHYLGFEGVVFIRGRSANNVRVTDPTMSVFNATVGLYDFDENCNNCTYEHIVSADTNTKLGITTGIKPLDSTGMFSSKDSFAGTGVIDTETEMFTIKLPLNSVTEITVKHRAVEVTAFHGTVQKEWKVLVSRGSGAAGISTVTESADQALSRSNINYGLDNSINITEPVNGTLNIGITTTSTKGINVVSVEERAELTTVTTKDVILTNKIP